MRAHALGGITGHPHLRSGPNARPHPPTQVSSRMFAPCGERVRSPMRVHDSEQPGSDAPAISLVVAVHQRPALLELVLASLEVQTFTDFEVLIADDGSGSE